MFKNWFKKRRDRKRKADLVVELKKILPAKIPASRHNHSNKISMVDPFSSQYARAEIIKILADKLL